MALPENVDEVAKKVKQALADTPYACASLRPLSGGNANFTFEGRLLQPHGGRERVLVKHGEDYVASNQGAKLSTSRCKAEAEALQAVQAFSPSSGTWEVKAPEFYAFYPAFNIQVQEFFASSMDLKSFGLEHYPPAAPSSAWTSALDGFGRSLGMWLGSFHEWAAGQDELRRVAERNRELKDLKNFLNYHSLVQSVDKFPAILGEAKELFEEVRRMADEEIGDEANLQVTHGDFWTGNILVPVNIDGEVPRRSIRIVDWEVCSLGVRGRDIGQVMAEMYQFKVFKDMEFGLWLMKDFVSGYAEAVPNGLDLDTAYRAAIHLGMHLVVIGGSVAGWGSAADVERVVATGRDIVVNAWKKNRTWFEEGELAFLFNARGSS